MILMTLGTIYPGPIGALMVAIHALFDGGNENIRALFTN